MAGKGHDKGKGKGHTDHGNGKGKGHDKHGCKPPVNPCLLSGTWIGTPRGPKLIEELRVGDLVSTVDHGARPILHISRRRYTAEEVRARRELVPYYFQPDPRDDREVRSGVHVSKWHRIFMPDWSPETPDGVLISAHHLAQCRPDLCWQMDEWGAPIEWLNIYTEAHNLIAADGFTVETGWLGGAMAPRLLGMDWHGLRHLAQSHAANPARPFVSVAEGGAA